MRTPTALALFALLVASSPTIAPAQPYSGDYFVSTCYYNPTPHCCVVAGLYRLTPTGQIITTLAHYVGRGAWLNYPAQMDAFNRHVISADWSNIYEWDATTNAPLRSLVVPGGITGLSAHHASGFAVVSNGVLMHLSSGLSTWTTIAPLKPTWPAPGAISIHGQDLWSGDYIIVDDASGMASLLSTDGRQSRQMGVFHQGWMSPAIAQSHLDGDFRVFSGTALLRVNPRTMARTTLSSGQLFLGSAATFDRAVGKGAISLLTTGIPTTLLRMDPSGRTIFTSPTISFNAYPTMIRHALDRDLAAIRQASPNLWWLQLNRPADAGHPYTIAVSMTGFTPGIPVGGRTIPLVPDALFSLSVQGRLAPFLKNNVGTLHTNGFGTAVLDLRGFGNALSGMKLWAAAAVSDPKAPSGLSLITKPVVLVLD